MKSTSAVLFDLDGTLADTAPDLADALNATLRAYGRDPLPFEAIRPAVSHGGIALVRLGFGLEPEDPGFEERRRHLLRHYRENLCRRTRLFPGMEEVLRALGARDVPWGVVTNKPAWLTEPLLQQLPLPTPPGCVVSGDSCPERKPHPMPLLHACRTLGCDPGRAFYVGDAERDMQAGKAAGMRTVCALFGYLRPEDRPRDWPADHWVQHPGELLGLLAAPTGEAASSGAAPAVLRGNG